MADGNIAYTIQLTLNAGSTTDSTGYDLLDPADYLVFNPIQTTRGCPHGGTFCTTPAIFGRKFRQRRIEHIAEEIRAAKEQYG